MSIGNWIKKAWDGLLGRKVGQAPEQHRIHLDNWAASPVGKEVLASEFAHLDSGLQQIFGFHLLEMSSFGKEELTLGCRINHRIKLSHQAPRANIDCYAEYQDLPFASESIDAVVLHHILEFNESPHQALREACRVAVPHGHIVVVGFNPFSLLGLWQAVSRRLQKGSIWCGHALRSARIKDWLRLLDCELVSEQHGFYRFPVQHDGTLSRCRFLEQWGAWLGLPVGGYYILIARKECAAINPLKPVWRGVSPVGLLVGAANGPTANTSRFDEKVSLNFSEEV